MSSALAAYRPAEHENPVQWLRRVFRTFRRTRPYYGGLLAMMAGFPIMYFPYAKLSLGGMTVAMATTAGAGSLIIGVLLIVLGLTAWFQPAVRVFGGVATILLTLVSIPVSNLAGFGLALLPGLIGGALMVSWAPLPEPRVASGRGRLRRRRGKDAVDVEALTAGPAGTTTAGPAGTAEAEAAAESATAAPTAELPVQGGAPGPAAGPATATVPRQAAGDSEEAR
ncbi:DUF6114 domain-containing protein [Kitasatospora sp. NPDC051705]|uniref:DUF6114 domain-containing protein n=1 Tax=Kitasatospora sp. NPDC051705 TaxID=3364057 RepID=UPI0037B05611